MTADITIGLPVRNGAPEIARAITAILKQRYGHFVLLISDNASTDDTEAICRRLAATDARIRYVRQSSDIGSFGNFRFVLAQAQTPFFLFAAHDDWLEPDVLDGCRRTLQEHPDASGAIPETIIHDPHGTARPSRGVAPMTGPAPLRLARYLARPADNSRFYGLYRTEALRRSFPADLVQTTGGDWVISALTLVEGAHVRAPGGRLHRKGSAPIRYARMARGRATSSIERIVPTAAATRALLRHLPRPLRVASLPSLLLLAIHQAVFHGWVTLRASRE